VRRFYPLFFLILLISAVATNAFAQTSVDAKLLEGMKWRLVGPYRGGRALTGVGVPGQTITACGSIPTTPRA